MTRWHDLPHDQSAVLGDLQSPLQVRERDGALLRRAWLEKGSGLELELGLGKG